MENLRPPRTQAHLRRLGYEICEKWPLAGPLWIGLRLYGLALAFSPSPLGLPIWTVFAWSLSPALRA
ncbi:protein of unknown function [Methylacidimicrobium sp. AP8]|nr:protein of unknown function [Methylacidimicrobium sp. AP8]